MVGELQNADGGLLILGVLAQACTVKRVESAVGPFATCA